MRLFSTDHKVVARQFLWAGLECEILSLRGREGREHDNEAAPNDPADIPDKGYGTFYLPESAIVQPIGKDRANLEGNLRLMCKVIGSVLYATHHGRQQ